MSIPLLPSFTRTAYKYGLKPLLFRFDPEGVHDRFTSAGAALGGNAVGRALVRAAFRYDHPMLRQTVDGVSYPNPIGLAAGFDKNGVLADVLADVGFGFVEVGSVTGEPCAGNPRPRLWRLPKSRALVVHYGLKNDGCETVAARLRGRRFDVPVGISVAKTNCARTADRDEGIADYAKAYAVTSDVGSYVTVNISCPNAYGGQPFTDPESLDLLLARLDPASSTKPTYVKLSPDLDGERLASVIDASLRRGVRGFICSNLTKNRSAAKLAEGERLPDVGGISGKAVERLADEQLRAVRARVGKGVTVIGCGGVFTAEDAYRKIRNGASLVQLVTGMIYEGPQMVGEVNRGLVRLLRRDGYANVADACGADAAKAAGT